MKIALQIATDERIALRRLGNELGKPLEEAAAIALRDWLIGNGYLELGDREEESAKHLSSTVLSSSLSEQ